MKPPNRYVSGSYRVQNPDWHQRDAPYKASAVLQALDTLRWQPRTIRDAGCGTGAVLWGLREHLDRRGLTHLTYEGWDIASAAIAQQRQDDRLRLIAGDPCDAETVADVVLCLDAFEHVPDDVGWLRQLKETGRHFVFRIPLDLSSLDIARPHRLLAARARWGHLHAYTRELAHAVLDDAGYHRLWETYHRVPPQSTSSRARWVDRGRRALFAAAPHHTVRWIGGWSLVIAAKPYRG